MAYSTAADMNAQLEGGADTSPQILIRQCRDLRRQEVCLRLTTLLLLLTCTALFVLTNTVEPREDQPNSRNKREAGSNEVEKNSECRTDDAHNQVDLPIPDQNNDAHVPHMRVDLRIEFEDIGDLQPFIWDATVGPDYYNKSKKAIIIPHAGLYFVYVRLTFDCASKHSLNMTLHHWSINYKRDVKIAEAWEYCVKGHSRNVFVGQVFALEKGDVSVRVHQGHQFLSLGSVFGAFAL